MPACLPSWTGRQVFTRRFYELSFLKAVLIVSSFNNTGTKTAKLYIKNSSRKQRQEFRPCVCLGRVNTAEWGTLSGPVLSLLSCPGWTRRVTCAALPGPWASVQSESPGTAGPNRAHAASRLWRGSRQPPTPQRPFPSPRLFTSSSWISRS